LVNDNWEVKISDFGQSNVKTDEINKDYNLTKYVTTRYYRAPELYLNYDSSYSKPIDLWSVGCIIAELFSKKVFLKANTTEDYLSFLVSLLGLPPLHIRPKIKNKNFLRYMTDNE